MHIIQSKKIRKLPKATHIVLKATLIVTQHMQIILMNKTLQLFLSIVCISGLYQTASAQCNPDNTAPVFINPPADTAVCAGNVPSLLPLNVEDECDGLLIAFSMDDTTSVNGFCNGGIIERTWSIRDGNNNVASYTQTITVEPDTAAPTSNADLSEVIEYVGENNFGVWVINKQNDIIINAVDDCSVSNISNDAPASFNDCGSIVVTFTLEDECEKSADFQVTYSLKDTLSPTFVNFPQDTTISCGATIPPIPTVTATDVGNGVVNIQFNEAQTPIGDLNCSSYQIIRTWVATDECSNTVVDTQIIKVLDETAPTFSVPSDTTLNCNIDFNDLLITGEPSNISEGCDSDNIKISFQDELLPSEDTLIVKRVWTVTDACKNKSQQTQTIYILDNEAPSFVVPTDVTVDCGEVVDLNITGRPTMVMDNCDTMPDINYEDVFSSGDCASGGAIQRVWRVTDDAGNITEQIQRISLDDKIAPTITVPAAEQNLFCDGMLSTNEQFENWVATKGGAVAEDNCTSTENLTWLAYNTGTQNTPTLPEPSCSDDTKIIRQQTVDFIVQDECGNRDTTTATFTLKDEIAPSFAYCPPDTILNVKAGNCEADFPLAAPIVKETCSASVGYYNKSINYPVVSDAPNNRDVVVNEVRLSFPVILSPSFASDSVQLAINLISFDGEQSPEYFNVVAEDGTILGRTNNASAQCGNSETVFTNISADQINQWAGSNSQITFYLQPNILVDQPGRFSINDICGGSSVEATLFFKQLTPSDIRYEYSINDSPKSLFNPPAPVFVNLATGIHTVKYFATDCAGNIDSCSYQATVVDNEPPVIDCPSDTTLGISGNGCSAKYQLPLPLKIKDNCNTDNANEITVPTDSIDALLTFTFDPDLNDYLADDKVFVFENLRPNAISSVTLTISLRADMDNTNGFFIITGDDGIPIMNTTLGQPEVTFGDCSNFSEIKIQLTPETYNSWAADGRIQITAFSNSAIPIPPGGPGDGINPCDPSIVNNNGDSDGVSTMFATLSFDNVQFTYFSEGATEIPMTTINSNNSLPEVEFSAGVTEIFYITQDANANFDTCHFIVTVADTEKPVAICGGTTIAINPSGTFAEVIDATEIDLGSSDNCGIDTMFVTPAIFDCQYEGRDTANVTLNVVDKSGNIATCQAPVRIISEVPEPSYFVPPCGGDTLFLFTNPPMGVGNNVYTYQWTGPNGFISNKSNPIITNITPEKAGSYQVTIKGITGCEATGIVEVAISNTPVTPDLILPSSICADEAVSLRTSVVLENTNVLYQWYSGTEATQTLIGTTNTPSLELGVLPSGIYSYFVIIEVNGCASFPSSPQNLEVVDIPEAIVADPNPPAICEGESIELSTFVVGADLNYRWTGPNGYTANTQNPPIIENATINDAGTYQLIISVGECTSEPANVNINVRPRPAQPVLTYTGSACEGSSITLTMNTTDATAYHWQTPDQSEQVTVQNTLTLNNISTDIAGAWRGYITKAGCDSELSAPLDVLINTNPNLSVSASASPICENNDLQLTASPIIDGATYEWSGPNGYRAVGINPVIENITLEDVGNYTCLITTAAGCTNTATTEVTVEKNIRITGISNSGGVECLTSPTDIKLAVSIFPLDDGTYTYNWEGPNNFTSTDSIATIPNATEASSGNYSVVVTNQAGCRSEKKTTIVSLMDAPAAPSTPTISEATAPPFCEGDVITLTTNNYSGTEVEYTWLTPTGNRTTTVPTLTIQSSDVNDEGEYAVLVRIDGCTSRQSGVTSVKVNAIPTISASSNSPICEGGQLRLETDFIEGATYRWEGPSGLTASGVNPVFPMANPDIHAGTYRVKAILNGCESTQVSVDVLVNEVPTLPVAISNGPICIDNDNAVLRLGVAEVTSTPGANYTWYDGDLELLGSPTTDLIFPINNFSAYTEGVQKFYVEAKLKGCSSGLSQPTQLIFNTIPNNQAFAGDDFIVCQSQSVSLDATQPSIGQGRWTQIGGDTEGVVIANPDDAKTTVSGLEISGTYTFRWTLSNGACGDFSSDDIAIIINPNEAADAGIMIDTCTVNSLQLNATLPTIGTGFWTQGDIQKELGITIENINDPNTIISGLEPGNLYEFTWNITEGTCGESSDVVTVIVSNGLAYAGEDFDECGDGCTNLNATPPPTDFGRWSSENSNITFNSTTDPNTLICGLEIGKNKLIWTTDNGACGDASIDTVIINYQPLALATPDTIITDFASQIEYDVTVNDNFVSEVFTINIVEAPKNGTVEVLEQGFISYQASAFFSGTDAFIYELCTMGCDCSEAIVIVNVGAETACRIPSIFTPNEDGINDAFIIPCLNDTAKFPNNEVIIFNQWGDEVFKQAGYQNNWRGSYNGENLPDGPYFYVINYGDGSKPASGYIMLQR